MKKFIVFISIGVICLMLFMNFKNSLFNTIDATHIQNISPAEAEAKIQENKVFLLDVRTKAEYDEKHYENATLIPVDELAQRLDEVPTNKDVLIYCRSGARAGKVSNYFINRKEQNIYVLNGFPLYTVK